MSSLHIIIIIIIINIIIIIIIIIIINLLICFSILNYFLLIKSHANPAVSLHYNF